MAKDWMSKLSTLDGAVNDLDTDIHSTVVQSRSPSVNFLFGNGWGLPLGYSVILYGPPKSGKSVLTYEFTGGIHRDYPDGWVIKFNTEYRERGQLTNKMAAIYGIDRNRYKAIETNHPKEIYDQIENKIAAWCKDGLPLKAVIIDSMNAVQGRRSLDGDIMDQQIGDVALTNKEGLKRVLAVQRRFGFSLIMTSHVAVEMDLIEQKRGNKFKMGASIGVQHHAEYFMFLEHDRRKEARQDILGQAFTDEGLKDLDDRAQVTAHKIRVVMKDSSIGPKGRYGYFTFSDDEGIINTWEEVYLLGKNRAVIQKPNSQMYQIPGYPAIRGEENFIRWLRDEPDAQEAILKKLRESDRAGLQKKFDAEDAVNAYPTVPDVEDEAGATAEATATS